MRAPGALVLARRWRIDWGPRRLQQCLTLQPQGHMQQVVCALCSLLGYLLHWVPTQQCHQSHQVPKLLESQWKLVRKKKKNAISILQCILCLRFEFLRSNSTASPYSGKCKCHIQPLDLFRVNIHRVQICYVHQVLDRTKSHLNRQSEK